MECNKDQFNVDQNVPQSTYYDNPPTMASAPPTSIHIAPITNQPRTFPPVGPKSMEMTCPSCNCRIKTNVRRRSTAKTHIACLLLTGVCCCCLPYCMDSCQNLNHFCPMCGTFLGTYS